ncbi:phospholipase D-like domain-containing protein [Wolbachia endosymbiont (group B) of Camptogramma bilineatum]|uniref:phospholipase D-like domain-containing protein n=1 Tax=Wolbachia endosymbiont (group B) of Camptogramma bilineatum TaxID=2953991 RepID=UPI00387830B9
MGHAKKSVLVQAYQFTSKPIAESLVQAKKRGVDIKVILDESQTIVFPKVNDKGIIKYLSYNGI